jgi:prepilin-type N-terminal cleavage/methylation domain-containing protein
MDTNKILNIGLFVQPNILIMKINRLKKNNGFGLIELIVGLFIIALLTGLSFANYHSTNNRSKLTLAAQAVLSDVKLAENYSLGMQVFNDGNVPAGGWGLRFDIASSDRYLIFADADEDSAYDLGEIYKTIVLPENINITAISETSPVDIVFVPPDPKTLINGSNSGTVDIDFSDGETSKRLNINFLGLADITN